MRIALGVEYDGRRFHGWQRQSHARSVQQDLEQSLSQIADHPVSVVCAGRTDTGVHGLGQVVHFDAENFRKPHAWLLGTNTKLPDDISLQWVSFVPDDFHARFKATSRQYRYIIFNRATPSALFAGRATWVRGELDIAAMQLAASSLLGEHDFTSFRAAGCQAKHAVRSIYSVTLSRSGQFVYLDIHANAFLHHMVRNIAGVLIAIGQQKKPVTWARDLLAVKDRTQAGVTAPPDGLYFIKVAYPEKYQLPVHRQTMSFG
ncbi:MAG TPA: tRNA pseudouridine(38-40) synthase TruA [Gammaproteobacteria bacterium]|nr:tRNA pseudouridine(38-40) synthase TruA [Gammaproteobacteria bacterium]